MRVRHATPSPTQRVFERIFFIGILRNFGSWDAGSMPVFENLAFAKSLGPE
jgi:hypothetical protein